MPFRTEDGKIVEHGAPFTLNGVDYGGTWLNKTSKEEQAAIGVTWQDDPSPPAYDPRFFTCTLKGEAYELTQLPLDAIKSNMLLSAERAARAMLDETDWMILRKIDINEPVPDDVTAFRAAVRAEENRIESEVTAADFEAIQLIEPNWPDMP